MISFASIGTFLEEKDAAFWKLLHLNVGQARYALRLVLASFITLLFVFIPAVSDALRNPAWAFATVQVIAMANSGSSISRGVNRLLGTAVAAGRKRSVPRNNRLVPSASRGENLKRRLLFVSLLYQLCHVYLQSLSQQELRTVLTALLLLFSSSLESLGTLNAVEVLR